jgi:hypothetical protein
MHWQPTRIRRKPFALELQMDCERRMSGVDLRDGIRQEIYAAGLDYTICPDDVPIDADH